LIVTPQLRSAAASRWLVSGFRSEHHLTGLIAFAFLLILLPQTLRAEPSLPLAIRNTAPAGLLFGVTPFRSEQRGLRIAIDNGNIFTGSNRRGVETVFDGETTIATLSWNHVFKESGSGLWSIGIEAPWIRHGGGVLDGFIEGYHDTFGFPDGGRDRVPRDRLLYRIVEGGITRLHLDASARGIGDLRVRVGREFLAQPDRRFSIHGAIELPTGEVDKITGSGGTDVALWAEYRRTGLLGFERLGISAMAGGVVPGESELLRGDPVDVIPIGHFGIQYRVSDRVELLAQTDGLGASYDIASDVLGRAAVQGTLGGRIRVWKSLWLDLAVVEDLVSDSTPDVIFHLSLGMRGQ